MARPRGGLRSSGLLGRSWLLVHGLPAERAGGIAAAGHDPREAYLRLRRSPIMKAVDERPVWSIAMYDDAGFVEVALRRPHRPVVPLELA